MGCGGVKPPSEKAVRWPYGRSEPPVLGRYSPPTTGTRTLLTTASTQRPHFTLLTRRWRYPQPGCAARRRHPGGLGALAHCRVPAWLLVGALRPSLLLLSLTFLLPSSLAGCISGGVPHLHSPMGAPLNLSLSLHTLNEPLKTQWFPPHSPLTPKKSHASPYWPTSGSQFVLRGTGRSGGVG